ncbi:MAG: hypothetical protein SFV81_03155 [Pirellulaceae bacterium]|nr:hypothetical protein [Pirellulaceae bacterium]
MRELLLKLELRKACSAWVTSLVVSIALASSLVAQEPIPLSDQSVRPASKSKSSPQAEFLRVTRTEANAPKTLDTSVTTYRSSSASGVTVDLIGAVHIGERQYYEELNRRFDQYDVLLYELVAPENTVIPRGGKRESTNPVAMLQDSAKNLLGLESQLELVDYTKAHFVRADMTPTQIADKMAERGETAFTVALSTLADVMRQQNLAAREAAKQPAAEVEEELGLFDLLGNPLKMKQIMAEQFVKTGSLDESLGGSLNQMLVIDRNAEALRGLQKQIAAGKKKIGIFYGAAHMPDFEKHLIADFGLQKAEQAWIAAWDLQRGPKNSATEPASMLLNLLKMLDE